MHCLVCHTSDYSYLYHAMLKKCNRCGFVTANMEISGEGLKGIYTEDYFKGEEYLDYPKEKQALQFNFRKRLMRINHAMPERVFGNVLEIGCAYGFFGETLRGNYPECQYTGIDIVQEPIACGKHTLNLNLIETDYLSFSPAKKFSDVFMWDVIEHLERPDLFLRKIYAELDNQGFLYLTTGDISSLLPQIQKRRWRLIHPPSHLHYFSKQTITQLLEKEGFRVKFIAYPPVYRSIKQIFYSLFILNKKKHKLAAKIFDIIQERWLVPLNTYDIMFVCAQKQG